MLNKLRKSYILISSLVYLPVLVFLVYAFIENTRFSFNPMFYMAWDVSPWSRPTHQIASVVAMAIPIVSCIAFLLVYFYKFYLSKTTGRLAAILCSIWAIINFLLLFGLRYNKFDYISNNVWTSNFKIVWFVILPYYGRHPDAIYIYLMSSILVFIGCIVSLLVKKDKQLNDSSAQNVFDSKGKR